MEEAIAHLRKLRDKLKSQTWYNDEMSRKLVILGIQLSIEYLESELPYDDDEYETFPQWGHEQ